MSSIDLQSSYPTYRTKLCFRSFVAQSNLMRNTCRPGVIQQLSTQRQFICTLHSGLPALNAQLVDTAPCSLLGHFQVPLKYLDSGHHQKNRKGLNPGVSDGVTSAMKTPRSIFDLFSVDKTMGVSTHQNHRVSFSRYHSYIRYNVASSSLHTVLDIPSLPTHDITGLGRWFLSSNLCPASPRGGISSESGYYW